MLLNNHHNHHNKLKLLGRYLTKLKELKKRNQSTSTIVFKMIKSKKTLLLIIKEPLLM